MQAQEERIVERYPTAEEKWAGHSVQASHFGVSTSSGGSLVAALLVPFGAAANAAYVQTENERQAAPLREMFKTDLRAALAARAPGAKRGDPAPGTGAYFALVPSAALDLRSDDEFNVRCALNVSLVEGGKELWRSRYVVQNEGTFARAKQEDIARAEAELGSCLAKAHDLFHRHKARQLGELKEYAVTAAYAMNVPVVQSALPGRVIYVDHLGLFEIRKSDVKSLTPR